MEILYEDNHLIAICKPHGLLVQADITGDDDVLTRVKNLIKTRDAKPGNVFLGLLHRLDRPVGGVLLLAKTSKAASRLSEQFRSHTISKVYAAVVDLRPGNVWRVGEIHRVIQWLVKDEKKNKVTPYNHEVPGSLRAELTFCVDRVDGGRALVTVFPVTGRPHQIRVALATNIGPIVGDVKYGSSCELGGSLALFAQKLSFDHPITHERVTVCATPELEPFLEILS